MTDGNSHYLMALGRHDGGHVVETADQQLREVIASVHRTGKKGSVTVTLDVETNGESGLQTSFKVSAKAPQVQFGKSFYFTDRQGDLTRNAPDYVQETLLRREDENAG